MINSYVENIFLFILPCIIIQGDEYIDDVNTLDAMVQSKTTTIDGDKRTNAPLQISTFHVEMKMHLMTLMKL